MTKFLQRVANEDRELLAEVQAIRVDGLTAEYVPDEVLTGSPEHPGSVTGYIKIGGAATSSVYRYDSGTNIATVGKTSGLTKFRVTNSSGSGRAIEVVGAANETSNTLEVFGSVHAVGSIGADVNVSSKVGFFVTDKISDATAAGYASGLAVAGSWVVYSSSDDDALKAVRKDLAVVVLAAAELPRRTFRGKTTAGGAVTTGTTLPLSTSEIGKLSLSLLATDGSYTYATGVDIGNPFLVQAPASMFSALLKSPPSVLSGFPLAPSFALTWTGGVMSVKVGGPSAMVTAAADNGSGKVRLTLSNAITGLLFSGFVDAVTDAINGVSVTVSGLSVCTEANGTHVATFVDATHVDFAAVTLLNPGADSGTLVEATPRTLTWSGCVEMLVEP